MDRKKRLTETLNDRIKIVRETLKITQQAMADKLGVSKSYYSDIENGRRSVSKRTIEKLNDIINVSIEWMYTGIGSIFNSNSDSDVHQNVPINVPFNDESRLLNLNTHSVTAVDNILSNSLQILSFYCDYLLYILYSSKLHKDDIDALKKYSSKLNQYTDEIKEDLRRNHNNNKTLDINDKINIINQLSLKIVDTLDLIREVFRKVKSIEFRNE